MVGLFVLIMKSVYLQMFYQVILMHGLDGLFLMNIYVIIKNITILFNSFEKHVIVFNLQHIQDGFNSSLRCSDYSLIPISHLHHPLVLYLFFTGYVNIGNFIVLRLIRGFRFYKTKQGMTYWMRKTNNASFNPLIVFHGVNLTGWKWYINRINTLIENRTVILVNYDATKTCSFNFHNLPMDPFTFRKNISEIIYTHNITDFSIFGHSWGTFLSSWILKSITPPSTDTNEPIINFSERITHVTLIDPVAITIFLPDTIHYLLYKRPKTVIDYLFRYFLTNDLTLSCNIQRHFEWHNMVLFLDEIPEKIELSIGFSMKDELICGTAMNEIVDNFITQRKQINGSAAVYKIVWKEYAHAGWTSKDLHP